MSVPFGQFQNTTMAHVTDSTTLGFTCKIGWDETEFKEGDFIQTEKNPSYVAQITEMSTKRGSITASASIIGEYPTRPFQPSEDNTISKADATAIRDALRLPSNGLTVGSIRDLNTTLYLPPNKAMQNHIGVYGKTGSGKSYTGAVIVEELLSLQKQTNTGIGLVLIDPHGEYGSLKLNPDGSASDYSVIEYGHPEYTDAPQSKDVRDVVNNPEELVQPTAATIVNLKGLDTETQQEIVETIASDLFQMRLREQIPPTKLVVEEAHAFAPTGGKTNTRDVIENIAKEGRKFSFTLNCITQRPSELYANVRAQMQTVFVHKLTDDTDIKKITKSTEGINKTWGTPIQKLGTGECLLAGDMSESPVFVDVRKRNTFHYESSGNAFNIEEYAEEPERVEEKQDKLHKEAKDHPVSKLKKRLQDVMEERDALEEQLQAETKNTSQDKVDELKEIIQSKNDTIESLRENVSELEAVIETLNTENDELRNTVDTQQQRITSLEEQETNTQNDSTTQTSDEEEESTHTDGYYKNPEQILENQAITRMVNRYHEKIEALDEKDAHMITYFRMNGASRPGDAYFYAGGKRTSSRASERAKALEKKELLTHERREQGRKYYRYALPEQIRSDLPDKVSEREAELVVEEVEQKLIETLPA